MRRLGDDRPHFGEPGGLPERAMLCCPLVTWFSAVGTGADQRINLTVGIELDAGILSVVDAGFALTRNDNLSGFTHQVNDFFPATNPAAWDDINLWVQGLGSNRAPTTLNAAKIAAGRTVFENANCTECHAGPKWTSSVVPYVPSQALNGSAPFALPDGGLPTTAPYLHDCEIYDLHDLFSTTYLKHLIAGNPAFFATGWDSTCAFPDAGISTAGDCVNVDDLVEFLNSIDGTTPIENPTDKFDICGRY